MREGGSGVDMKRVGTAMEQHHARELAELDEIGMASGHRRVKKTKDPQRKRGG